jgi:hypothetical protein
MSARIGFWILPKVSVTGLSARAAIAFSVLQRAVGSLIIIDRTRAPTHQRIWSGWSIHQHQYHCILPWTRSTAPTTTPTAGTTTSALPRYFAQCSADFCPAGRADGGGASPRMVRQYRLKLINLGKSCHLTLYRIRLITGVVVFIEYGFQRWLCKHLSKDCI